LNLRPSVPQIDAPQTTDLRGHPETASDLQLSIPLPVVDGNNRQVGHSYYHSRSYA